MNKEMFFGSVKKIVDLFGEFVKFENIYTGIFAQYYNMLPVDEKELKEYLDTAFDCGKDILELCCGNGRLSIEFAKNGFFVDGVDCSEDMLSLFKNKVNSLPKSIAKRIKIINMDIFNIDLIDKKYDFVYLPATTICILLEDRKKVIKLFDDISDILKPNGRFCFDIRLYDKLIDKKETATFIDTLLLENKRTLVIFQERFDIKFKRAVANFYLQTVSNNNEVEQWASFTNKKMVSKSEIEDLINQSKLVIDTKKVIKEGTDDVMVFTLRKEAAC
jgi:SAM-dependent methyltransferase